MPKFKEGELVECTENALGQFTKGKTYEVRRCRAGQVDVVADDRGNCNNGWTEEFFKRPDPVFVTNTARPGETAEQIAARAREVPTIAPAGDVVVKPSHYTRWAIEPITFIMRNKMEFWRGNAIKYIARSGYKLYPGQDETQSQITDLRKAIRVCEMRINELNGETTL
jgi:hypothetical protein